MMSPVLKIQNNQNQTTRAWELHKWLTSSGFLNKYTSMRHVFVPVSSIHNIAEALSKIYP